MLTSSRALPGRPQRVKIRREFDVSEGPQHNRFLRWRYSHPIEDGFWRHLRQAPSPRRDVPGGVVLRRVSRATTCWDYQSPERPISNEFRCRLSILTPRAQDVAKHGLTSNSLCRRADQRRLNATTCRLH